MVEVPAVTNLGVEEASQTLRNVGLVPLVQGAGQRVLDQFPPQGVEVEEGTSIIVYTIPRGSAGSGGSTTITVPDLSGMTMKEAAGTLAALELQLEPVGSGVAGSQEPKPGATVAPGSTIRVQFSPSGGD